MTTPDRPPPDPGTATPTRARRKAAGIPGPAELGRRVKAARLAAGLTQREAGARLGVGQQACAMREATTSLPYATLLELVLVLGYDPAILCPELAGRSRGPACQGPAAR